MGAKIMTFKKIVVIGMGYVGIPAAALFAEIDGVTVTGIQRRSKRSGWKIDYLNKGKCPIGGDEPGLPELIEKVVKSGSFHVTDDFSICRDADAILIDVQTPVESDHMPRYQSLKSVCHEIGPFLKDQVLITIESTVAPGTTEYIAKPILEESSSKIAGKDFYLAFSYERVMVGKLLYNLQYLPRIVGGLDEKSTNLAMDLYKLITKSDLHATTAMTAELAKVVENTYRDINIAFANEVALICESLGADVFEVRELVNTLPNDPANPATNPYRNMHLPGAGVGGHCLPKDPWLLKYGLDNFGRIKFNPQIIVQGRAMNDYMPVHMLELLKRSFKENGNNIKNAKIAVLGYAFIANSDDTRNTPALPLINLLNEQKYIVIVHDPYVKTSEEIEIQNDLEKVLSGADAIMIVTNHKQYYDIDLVNLRSLMNTPIIIDGRNIFDAEKCQELGFVYNGVGKG
jgi:UDP-N-acetyl-D-mannosaminuronic acid dehydrogenase